MPLAPLFMTLFFASQPTADEPIQARVNADIARGDPLVVYVAVALADDTHQPLAPLPHSLGDGDRPHVNLYWGARYGIATHLPAEGWKKVGASNPKNAPAVLTRSIFTKSIRRGRKKIPVKVIADAYRGREIRAAIQAFAAVASGEGASLELPTRPHLLLYVGHNGLMDFDVSPIHPTSHLPPIAAGALACISESDFSALLPKSSAQFVVGTTGLMAPEAYLVDAIVHAFAAGRSEAAIRKSAAKAYARFHPSAGRAHRLFNLRSH